MYFVLDDNGAPLIVKTSEYSWNVRNNKFAGGCHRFCGGHPITGTKWEFVAVGYMPIMLHTESLLEVLEYIGHDSELGNYVLFKQLVRSL